MPQQCFIALKILNNNNKSNNTYSAKRKRPHDHTFWNVIIHIIIIISYNYIMNKCYNIVNINNVI